LNQSEKRLILPFFYLLGENMNREYTLLDMLRLTQCLNCKHLTTCDYGNECEDENKMCVYYEDLKEDGKWHKTE